MTPGATLVKLENASKSYAVSAGAPPVFVLRDVTLEIASGESIAIIGPSGSGKSTFLNLIGTLDQPTTGRIWLDGQDLSGLPEPALAQIRNRQIGFIFQGHHLL